MKQLRTRLESLERLAPVPRGDKPRAVIIYAAPMTQAEAYQERFGGELPANIESLPHDVAWVELVAAQRPDAFRQR